MYVYIQFRVGAMGGGDKGVYCLILSTGEVHFRLSCNS